MADAVTASGGVEHLRNDLISGVERLRFDLDKYEEHLRGANPACVEFLERLIAQAQHQHKLLTR